MLNSFMMIAVGATLGAWLRWLISLKLNNVHALYPIGTLVVNCLGGLIIGYALGFFAQSPIHPQFKLLIMTGFCGGLTTFSTFSVETLQLLQHGQLSAACVLIVLHVLGALFFTFVGLYLQQLIH